CVSLGLGRVPEALKYCPECIDISLFTTSTYRSPCGCCNRTHQGAERISYQMRPSSASARTGFCVGCTPNVRSTPLWQSCQPLAYRVGSATLPANERTVLLPETFSAAGFTQKR